MSETPHQATPPASSAALSDAPDAARPRPPLRALERLHPAAITLWRMSAAFRGAVFVAFAVAGELIVDLPVRAGLPAVLLGIITLFVVVLVPPARYRAWGYRLREEDLYLRHGILFRTTSIIPHARIQHVDTRHGPVDRWLGLADVVVFTAGTRGAMVTIPALERETAEGLRDRLAALSGAGDAV